MGLWDLQHLGTTGKVHLPHMILIQSQLRSGPTKHGGLDTDKLRVPVKNPSMIARRHTKLSARTALSQGP